MRIKILNFWYHLHGSFWFVPALMTVASMLLSIITPEIDKYFLYRDDTQNWWIYSGGPDGARTVLSVIAASMISVAGVVFSITIVVLSLASSQFGPRLIRNFMNVRANQMVLGTFVATFTYSILVLRTVNASMEARFIPGLSVTVAMVMSLFGLGVLIYFIHTVSESIQAQNIIARVRRDLENAVDRIFPEKLGQGSDLSHGPIKRDYDIPTTCDSEVCQVKAECGGYLQAIDNDALMQIAVEEDLLIHLGHRPGNFITRHGVLVTVWPGDRIDEKLSNKINAIIIVGPERTLEQDVEFAISQLVEIAVRALSPGINDPITAITCIDWLGDILCQLASRKMPSSHRYDQHNRLRVICKPFTFEGMVDAAFNMIRQNSRSVAAVSIHLLETIATIAAQTPTEKDRAALLRHASLVADGCKESLSAEDDRKDLEKRYEAVVKTCNAEPASIALNPEVCS
ncbi:MAG: DUF2254 domain-containing protein [Desulfobacterales bacterium]|jgi:uncharacterized membrane protein